MNHGLQEGERITLLEGRPSWWRVIRLVRWWLRRKLRRETTYYVANVTTNTFRIRVGPR